MAACRISKVTCKKTGRELVLLPPAPASEVDQVLREAREWAVDNDANSIGIVLVSRDGFPWSTSQHPSFGPPPAALLGGLFWLGARVLKTSGGLDDM